MDLRPAPENEKRHDRGHQASLGIYPQIRKIQRSSFAKAGRLRPGDRNGRDADGTERNPGRNLRLPEEGTGVAQRNPRDHPRVLLQNPVHRTVQQPNREIPDRAEEPHPTDRQTLSRVHHADLQLLRNHQEQTQGNADW
jgi:hypothetical protein